MNISVLNSSRELKRIQCAFKTNKKTEEPEVPPLKSFQKKAATWKHQLLNFLFEVVSSHSRKVDASSKTWIFPEIL